MTMRNIVADGRSEAERRGLVQAKANELVRRVLEGTLELDWVLKRMQDVIEGPSGWEEMIYAPIEWGTTYAGSVLDRYSDLEAFLNVHGQSLEETPWRLPTINELGRGLKSNDFGFHEGCFYFSGTPGTRQPGVGNEVMSIRCGHLCGSDFRSMRGGEFYIRLCRSKKVD